MSSTQISYAHFVPAYIAKLHAGGVEAPSAASTSQVRGTVVFVDIVGYTALTEFYAQREIETLSLRLNKFFGSLETLASCWGGDIMSFAGDAMLILWTDDKTKAHGQEETCDWRAANFAQRALASVNGNSENPTAGLSIQISVVSGIFDLVTAGGVDGHWYCVVNGAPLAELNTHIRSASYFNMIINLLSASDAIKQTLTSSTVSDNKIDVSKALRSYIPAPVLEHLDTGKIDWMSEYRIVTTVFVGWDGTECHSADGLCRFQAAVVIVQEVVSKFGGTLTRVLIDGKGANALLAWGIPGQQHEDNPIRAVRAGLMIEKRLYSKGIATSVGISTGRVLCGLTGGGKRYEYSLSGNAANLAARLMSIKRGAVLCDAATMNLALYDVSFESIGQLKLKGRELPCHVFRAIDRQPPGEQVLEDSRQKSMLVGRTVDRKWLNAKLRALLRGQSNVLLFSGEPGIGKTSLLRDLIRITKDCGCDCFIGRAECVEAHTMYFPWRVALLHFLHMKSLDTASDQRSFVKSLLVSHPRLDGWLALINDVVPLGFAETSTTLQMSEQSRAEGTAEIVVCLLENLAMRRPILLVFDDAQWLDSLSWQLAYQVSQHVSPVLIALSIRSGLLSEIGKGEIPKLLSNAERLELKPLNRDDTATLLSLRLGANTIACEVVDFIYKKSAGNPFFSEEIALAMCQRGHLQVDDSHCALSIDSRRSADEVVANTVQGVIASRIDLLTPRQKTTLKIASVLGPRFPLALLVGILDDDEAKEDIENQFHAFERLELLMPDFSTSLPHFLFKHGITCDVAYQMLIRSEKCMLHAKVAKWYEREHFQDLSPFYSILAHHWESSGNRNEALFYLHKAGEQAVNRFANIEAVDFLKRSIFILDDDLRPSALTLKASCERLLGIALLWSGRLVESRTHLQKSVALLGIRVPHSPLGQTLSSIAQIVWHLFRRLKLTGISRNALSEKERDAAMVMLRLGHVGYFQEDSSLMMFTCIRCIDFAERAEQSREGALMIAALSLAAGSIPLHRIAINYGERAVRIANLLGDASVSAQVHLFYGIYLAGIGNWHLSLHHVQRAEAYAVICGDNRRREECLVLYGFLHFHQGRCSAAILSFKDAADAARIRGDMQTCAWGLIGLARSQIRQGKLDVAYEALMDARLMAFDRVSMIELHGHLALLHLQRHEFSESLAAARQVLALTTTSRSTSFTTLTGMVGMTEVLVERWSLVRASRVANNNEFEFRRDANLALRALTRFARIFPIGRASLLLLRGKQQYVLGHPARALVLLRKAIESARRLELPYEEAKAEIALASLVLEEEAIVLQIHACSILRKIASDSVAASTLKPFYDSGRCAETGRSVSLS